MNHLSNEEFFTATGILVGLIIIFVFANLIRNRRKRENQLKEKPRVHSQTTEQHNHQSEGNEKEADKLPAGIQLDGTAKVTWINRLRVGLLQTHSQIVRHLDEFFTSKKDKVTRAEALEFLFEILVQADVGVKTSELLVERVKNRLTKDDLMQTARFREILRDEILQILNTTFENKKGCMEAPKVHPHVVLMVGVNGVGKTTTTGKLAFKAHEHGQKVLIGAADTFRAAAVEQLAVWADRARAEMIRLKEGADPASVAFEAVKKARETQADICLIDTAGRLQTRHDLMQELSKVGRVVAKDMADAPHEVLLVLDATTGQNAIQQAKLFREAINVTGLIITKLDGSAKGGVAIAIAADLGLPIRYIGVGESVEDLEIFQAQEFVDALFR